MPSRKPINWPRAEILMLTGIFLIVLSIAVPGWLSQDAKRRSTLARTDLDALVTASERFFLEYGYWPSPHMGTAGDMRYASNNRLVMNALRAVDGPGNEGHRLNPNRIVFIQLPPYRRGTSGLNEDGDFIDPWGMPYRIALDTDLDNTVTMTQSRYRNQTRTGIAAWSSGADRRPDTPQDIVSWD